MPQITMNDPRLDSAENLWFSRQLETILAGSYDVLYAEMLRLKLFLFLTRQVLGLRQSPTVNMMQ